eukprot:TRINITY_DN26693_c0_g1_i1.p1 TRINITY_DN26693_c0_g1~~TRINITY_DN26693_c0_g1_i1.p1  ORF type:complete len:512 (+),score=120.65 TRINITY_DN26693_c0_g1_i1:48-1583(+)
MAQLSLFEPLQQVRPPDDEKNLVGRLSKLCIDLSAEAESGASPAPDDSDGVCYINDLLPVELLFQIFSWFDADEVELVSKVCRSWKTLSCDTILWHDLYGRRFGISALRHLRTDAEQFFWAIKFNRKSIVAYLLRHNRLLLNEGDPKGGYSALYRACQYGHLRLVRMLIEESAMPLESTMGDAPNRGDGSTAFYIACQENQTHVVQYLINRGANIECTFKNGFTPMYIAAEKGNLEVVKILYGHGARINMPADRNAFPLYIAAQNGHAQVVEFLIDHGADTEIKFNGLYKPIYIAQSRGNTAVVELMRRKGANSAGLEPWNAAATRAAAPMSASPPSSVPPGSPPPAAQSPPSVQSAAAAVSPLAVPLSAPRVPSEVFAADPDLPQLDLSSAFSSEPAGDELPAPTSPGYHSFFGDYNELSDDGPNPNPIGSPQLQPSSNSLSSSSLPPSLPPPSPSASSSAPAFGAASHASSPLFSPLLFSDDVDLIDLENAQEFSLTLEGFERVLDDSL